MSRFPMKFALAAAACALLAPGVVSAGGADTPPPAEVVTAAKTAVAAARKAAKGDGETVKSLKATRAALEPFAAWSRAQTGTNGAQFATVWNELMTVADFHGAPGKADYILVKSEILWKRYLLGLPTGGAWTWENNGNSKTNDQLHMFVNQVRPSGQKLRQIKVWTYRWDTTYSGIGGENSKGLAKSSHEADRDSTAKTKRKVSPEVTAKRMNAEFDRTYYYFVEGFDVDEEKNIRRDNYYFKGSNCSFNFEIITYSDPGKDDDVVTKWQCSTEDPEIRAVLDSIATNPNGPK